LIGAVCGVIAAAVAMGVAQLLAGISIPQSSPVLAVGQADIDATPLAVKDWATSTFGTNDKNVLLTGVLMVVFLYAAGVGILAVRSLRLGMAGIAVFAALGMSAALTRPGASPAYVLPTLGGAAVGAFALYRLVVKARAAAAASAARAPAPLPPIVFGGAGSPSGPGGPGGSGGSGAPGGELRAPDLPGTSVPPLRVPPRQPSERRAFLVTAGVSLAGAAAGGYIGRQLTTRHNVTAARSAVRFPRPAVAAPALPAGSSLPIPGISPFITPNGAFYRVDTALLVPEVDPRNWTLRIHGMVAREIEVTFDDLLRRPLIEDYVTLCCVSNPVSGPYIGNAKFLGASYGALIREARPLRGADQLFCTSVDGFTSGTPLSVVLDTGRDSLVAVAMNDAPLPVDHGFPARLVVPGLYGYVSACKWVADIQVTTFAAATAYWGQRGWSQQAPIKTESRIDVPAGGSSVKAGRVAVAGVAWAQHKGIEAVEVRVDGGPWQQATLAAVPDLDTWRQWVWYWDAKAGPHLLEARATDKTGYTQTALQADVAPNGATGYPQSQITVF